MYYTDILKRVKFIYSRGLRYSGGEVVNMKRLKLVLILDVDEEKVMTIYSHQLIDSDFLQFLKGRIEEALIEYNQRFSQIEALKELSEEYGYASTVGDFDDIDPAPID